MLYNIHILNAHTVLFLYYSAIFICSSNAYYTQAPTQSHKSYFEPFLSVTLWSIPLNNGLSNVQQKHISKIEAVPAHFHLKHIKSKGTLSTQLSVFHKVKYYCKV